MNPFLGRLGIRLPIIQAPMAGISTPEMAAAVSNAGGLGSIGVGSVDAEAARRMIGAIRAKSDGPFNVNVFCHRPATADPDREAAWIEFLAPHFARFGAKPPSQLREIYKSFLADDAMLKMFLSERPAVVSFHFGVPPIEWIRAMKERGTTLFATATNLQEARAIHAAGIDAIVAQGYEAGGHRGTFDPGAPDERLGTLALTRLLAKNFSIPIIASGGIMDGAGIAASLLLGASAAQLGTAFVPCPESAADSGYRAALLGDSVAETVMTPAISGRAARSLANELARLGAEVDPHRIPDYPIAYDATKSLNAAAKSAGEFGYGVQWAGQGAALSRTLPAGELVTTLWRELQTALTTIEQTTARPS